MDGATREKMLNKLLEFFSTLSDEPETELPMEGEPEAKVEMLAIDADPKKKEMC